MPVGLGDHRLATLAQDPTSAMLSWPSSPEQLLVAQLPNNMAASTFLKLKVKYMCIALVSFYLKHFLMLLYCSYGFIFLISLLLSFSKYFQSLGLGLLTFQFILISK